MLKTLGVFKLSFPQDKYVVGAVSGGVDSSVAAVRKLRTQTLQRWIQGAMMA